MSRVKFCNTRIHRIWSGMKQRCYNPSCKEYRIYGGRGIRICDEWIDKKSGSRTFYNWAKANGYRADLSIDRIDVNGNYCPENCRWATRKQQGRNKRTTIMIEFDGKIRPLRYWSRKYNIDRQVIYRRYKNGVRGKQLFFPKGIHTKTLSQYDIK